MKRYPKNIRVPSLPRFIVLTDRDDGTEWVLSHVDDMLHCTINDGGLERGGLRPHLDYYKYGPFDGPILATDPRVMLLCRGGRLGFEVIETPGWADKDQARILTRKNVQRRFNEIKVPSTGWTFPFPSLFRRGLAFELVVA